MRFKSQLEASASSLPFVPRGLSRAEAAAYIGVSPGTFDKLISDGLMPKPGSIRARKVWDRVAVDAAFTDLMGGGDDESAGWEGARV